MDARTFANIVLPVPGGPYSSTPRGRCSRRLLNNCGSCKGAMMRVVCNTVGKGFSKYGNASESRVCKKSGLLTNHFQENIISAGNGSTADPD